VRLSPSRKEILLVGKQNLTKHIFSTTITVEKCEQRTVKIPLHDETDDVIESPPPRYTRYDNRPCTMFGTESTSAETLDREYVDSDAQYPAPPYRSLQKTVC
jgi:hypothetical protein